MLKEMAMINVDVSSVYEIRELAKDEDVFYLFNTYDYEKRLFERQGRTDMVPEDPDKCWRIKPLRDMVNDKKDDFQVEAFLMGLSSKRLNCVFRMRIA